MVGVLGVYAECSLNYVWDWQYRSSRGRAKCVQSGLRSWECGGFVGMRFKGNVFGRRFQRESIEDAFLGGGSGMRF